MSGTAPRLRMFAGPNGSCKSTMKSVISARLLGVYINPDEIESELRAQGSLNFTRFEVQASAAEMRSFLQHSALMHKAGLVEHIDSLRIEQNRCFINAAQVNSYYASAISDFIRQKLLASRESFTFETVMSSPDKIELLQQAQAKGFRTYLYYVATEDPSINISRVRQRVKSGGHDVPEDKICSRYARSLNLLFDAIRYSNRAYIFDNSGHQHIWVSEITNGIDLEFRSARIPAWFKRAVLNKVKR